MYLKKIKIIHYRKFNEKENEVCFVGSKTLNKANVQNIDVASNTTLIIGKNNAGKSTVINALNSLINNYAFSINDFNYSYLTSYFKEFGEDSLEGPYIEFVLTIQLEENGEDILSNLFNFMRIGDIEDKEVTLRIRYEVENFVNFNNKVKEAGILNKKAVNFENYVKIFEDTSFKLNYYDKNGNSVSNFKLSSLMEIEPINANKLKNDHCLTDSFNKIVSYRYNQIFESEKEGVIKDIESINRKLTGKIQKRHKDVLTKVLSNIVSTNNVSINLKADITFDKLMNDLIKYEYLDNKSAVPENQFGLGYTNLIMIIVSIIGYIEKYPDTSFNSKINIISIEEPETFMHPQMQELFVKNIEGAIKLLLEEKNKNVNFQLLITTHSSHILNSKIDSDNGFDNICYLKEEVLTTTVTNISNELIVKDGLKENRKEFVFIKKNIKYKVSELFFCDAAIFVEGYSEMNLLPYYLETQTKLNKNYITIFNIGGAHAHLYAKLIEVLKVPVLIVTDLDIKRTEEDGTNSIKDIRKRETSNSTLRKLLNSNMISEFYGKNSNKNLKNIYVAYQKKENDVYPTSFEEAMILANYDNKILNESLKQTRPNYYKSLFKNGTFNDSKLNIDHSYSWQQQLTNSKGDFSSNLLFNILNADSGDEIPKLPKYITDGLQWLEKELKVK